MNTPAQTAALAVQTAAIAELDQAIAKAHAAGVLVIAATLTMEDFSRRYPKEMVVEVFKEANSMGCGLDNMVTGRGYNDVSSFVVECIEKRLDAEVEKADFAAEEAAIAARTPEQWAAEVTRLESLLKDPEAARVELTDYLKSELAIAKSKASAAGQ